MFILDIDSFLRFLHCVGVGTIFYVSGAHAASMYRVQVSYFLYVVSFLDISGIHSASIFMVNTRLVYCDSVHEGYMYFRNVSITAHINTVERLNYNDIDK
jgi:hypothetical protein